MYREYLSSELRKWIRDPMMRFLLIYPLVFGSLGRYLVPFIYEANGIPQGMYADILLTILALFTPLVYGAILGFSLLEDRDEGILVSIRVTPMSLLQFLSFKLLLVFLCTFFSTAFVLAFSLLHPLPILHLFLVSLLSASIAPATGLFINALSKNKIEGFAVMKGFGTLLIVPVVSLFFFDRRELLFLLVPGVYPARVLSFLIRGEGLLGSLFLYYLLGFCYALLLNLFAGRVFSRRALE